MLVKEVVLSGSRALLSGVTCPNDRGNGAERRRPLAWLGCALIYHFLASATEKMIGLCRPCRLHQTLSSSCPVGALACDTTPVAMATSPLCTRALWSVDPDTLALVHQIHRRLRQHHRAVSLLIRRQLPAADVQQEGAPMVEMKTRSISGAKILSKAVAGQEKRRRGRRRRMHEKTRRLLHRGRCSDY